MAEHPRQSRRRETFSKTFVDLVGGTFGGSLQALVGHPFETVKVRLQNQQTAGGSLRDVVRSIVREEGVTALYKGVTAPFFANGFLNAVLFSANSLAKDAVGVAAGRASHAELDLHHIVMAAWLTAPIYCGALVPVEVVKVRLQAQKGHVADSAALKYRGPIHCFQRTLAEEGLAGVYRGYGATVCMRAWALPFYFASYEFAKKSLTPSGEAPSTAASLAAGSFAGMSFWTAGFPLDTIKTRLQARSGGAEFGLAAVGKEARAIMASPRGIHTFFDGLLPCILRAAPANAAVFVAVEWTRQGFAWYEDGDDD